MFYIPFRKKPLAVLTASIFGLSVLAGCGADGDDGTDGVNGTDGVDGASGIDGLANYKPAGLTRLATAPLGAEVTGLYLNSDGSLFMNFQHPADTNSTADANGRVYNKGTIGAVVGQDFSTLGDFDAVDMPIITADKEVPHVAVGSYRVLAQQGDALADGNALGDILAADGTTLLTNNNDPDFNGVIPTGIAGEYYVYTNWENRPGGMSRLKVSGSPVTGYTTVAEGMVDFSGVKGTWVNCFGTVSPWNTPLSAEELYFDNTADWFATDATTGEPDSNAAAVAQYLGYPADGSGSWANPYRYGYIVELTTADAASEANVVPEKREALGRFSHENAVVMPDEKTVYLSDDGTGTVFFKFVADTAGDLSAGTLYAAKITQANGVTDPAEAALGIEWVKLGHASEADIESWIAEYDSATIASPAYIDDGAIAAWAADMKDNGALDTVADARVAFLESRKAAVALGATGEFRKMEGVNINYGLASNWWAAGAADGPQAYMYMAMSNVNKTMGDTEGDIQLDATHGNCGAVYRMKLKKGVNGEVDVDTMIPAIVGGPYHADRAENACNVNNISEPDNLLVLDDGRVIIGEDTGEHENNMVWVFDDPDV